MTVEWYLGRCGTWASVAGDVGGPTVYWEEDGSITMTPARGRARVCVIDRKGDRIRRKTFAAFLHVAERTLAVHEAAHPHHPLVGRDETRFAVGNEALTPAA